MTRYPFEPSVNNCLKNTSARPLTGCKNTNGVSTERGPVSYTLHPYNYI